MKRLVEFLKTVLIVLLLCSLVLLAVASVPTDTLREIPWLSSVLQPIAPLLGLPQAELAYVAAAPTIQDAALPVAISVRNSAGRSSAFWDFEELDARFDTLGSFLGQALDTAETFTKTSEPQLQAALSRSSVYFRYSAALPPALTASWLGATLEAAVPASVACLLAVERNTVMLYLIGENSYVAQTPLDCAALEDLLETYRPDGSAFAFEAGYDLSPMSLIPSGPAAVPGGDLSSPVSSRYVEQLATDLGFNPYGESRYTGGDGAIHFSEAHCALEITTDGRVLLTATDGDRFNAAGPDLAALVETARQLTALAAGDSGDGRLYLSGVTRSDTQTVCTFDYLLSGIPVILDSGHAATVTFEGTAVTQMTLWPWTFTCTDQTIYPIPAPQAAAILPDGSELTLQYRLQAGGTLDAGWKK